jgi:hypothetical protein
MDSEVKRVKAHGKTLGIKVKYDADWQEYDIQGYKTPDLKDALNQIEYLAGIRR